MFILLLLAAAATPVLHINATHDSGLPCPAYSALRTRLQTLDPASLEENPRAEPLQVSLNRQIGGWNLRLNRTSGEVALERNLDLGETDCALVAESAALVIDRYLAALREPSGRREAAGASLSKAPPAYKHSPAPPPARPIETTRAISPSAAPRDPAPSPEATPPIPSAPQPAAPIAAAIAPTQPGRLRELVEPVAAPERGQLSVAVGPAGIIGLPSDLRAAIWLDVEHPINFEPAPRFVGLPISFMARFLFLGSASSAQPVIIDGADRGDISARSILFAVTGGPCATKWLRFCAGGFAGARLVSGGSEGDGIFAQGDALLAQPEFGAIISIDRALGARVQLRFSVLAGAAPGTASMSIQGGPSRRLSTVDLAASILIGYQIY